MGEVICNCLALRQAARKTTQLYDRALAVVGLRSTQYSILSQLRSGKKATTIGELADGMVMDRATLGHNLKPLERAGLVSIGVGSDKRERVVSLTDDGVARLREARPLWARAQRAFEDEVGRKYSVDLRRDLGRVSSAAFTVAAPMPDGC